MDVSKTFDSIYHSILLAKLQLISFRGKVSSIEKPHLQSSHQCVSVTAA